MKKILLSLCFFSQFLVAQSDPTGQDTIVIREDSLYFLQSIIITDNGTDFPDTSSSILFLGDSIQARNYLYNQAWAKANFWSGLMRRAFQRSNLNREYNSLSTLFQQVTNKTLTLENQEELFDYYKGAYRVSVIEPTSFAVEVIQLPSGALRMEREDDGTRYNFQPRNRNFFRVNIGGIWYSMHYSFNNANEKRTYEEELRATGTRDIVIVKQ